MFQAKYNRPSFTAKRISKFLSERKYAQRHVEKFKALTRREREIISLVLQGLHNGQIADKLFISRRTVEQHRKNINAKLSINNFAQLFRFGYAFEMV